MNNIIGHQKQRNLLRSALKNGNLAHALLFNGISSIGKKLVAFELAKSFYCENNINQNHEKTYGGCDKCQSCKLFNEGTIPDFYYIDCQNKEEMKTENIRELLHKLSLKNFSSKSKFIIFNDAHLLKEQCSNILLKTLEEPKENTFFILITSNYSKLPMTIVSRCQLWNFDALSQNELKEIISKKNIILQDNSMIELLEGSLENIDILSVNIAEKKFCEESIDLILKGDVSALNTLSKKISKDKDNIKYYLALLRNIIRQKMIKESNNEMKTIFAVTLENIIFSDYLILDRYLNKQDVLNNIFINLLPHSKYEKMIILENYY